MTYVPGFGPKVSQLMIVGEAPGREDEINVPPMPFVGMVGRKIDELLQSHGSSLDNHYRTNIVKYRPPNGEIKRLGELGHNVEENIEQFWQEVGAINPNCILALGNTALFYLTGHSGIGSWRGSLLRTQRHVNGKQIKVVATVHPAKLIPSRSKGKYEPKARAYVSLDFKKALQESQEFSFSPPIRNLEIARTSADVYGFLQRYKDKKIVSIDIETPKCIPVCIGLAFSQYHGMSIPLLNLEGNEFQVPIPELVNIHKELREFFRTEPDIIGQNFKFDHQKLSTVTRFPIKKDIYADTMLMAHCLHSELPADLGFLASIYSREPYYKTEGKEFNPKKDKLERLFLYNAKDAVVTYEVYETLLVDLKELGLDGFFFNHIIPLHSVYMEIESHGFRVDQVKKKELKKKYNDWRDRSQQELDTLLTYELNVNSPKKIAFVLYEDLNIPRREGTGEDILVGLLANTVKDERKRRIIELILEIRRVRRTISNVLDAHEDYDGRMRTSYHINGTETGRTSTKKLKSPLRPTKKGVGLNFQNLTKHGDIGQDVREMYIPDEGFEFLEADLSQAEPRVVALLSEDYELLDRFARGEDIHRLTTTWIFGIPDNLVTQESRFVGKICRNGGNYDMGKHRLMETVMTEGRRAKMNIQLSEWKANQVLEQFHKYSPKIRGVYHEQIERHIRSNNMSIINPYGRLRLFFDEWEKVRKAAFAHLASSTVADKLKTIIRDIRDKKPSLKVIVEAHDALLFQGRIGDRTENLEIIRECFERPINFEKCSLPRGMLRIPCEISVGMDYKNLTTIYKGV